MPAQKNRDGRSAFFNLKLHYLGVNNIDNMATTAERDFKKTYRMVRQGGGTLRSTCTCMLINMPS